MGRGARGGASHEMRVGSCGKKLKWRTFFLYMGYNCFSQPSFQEILLSSSLRELLHECGSEPQVVDFFCTSWVAHVLHTTSISREITIIIITEGALHECGSEAKFCILVLSVVHNLHFKRDGYHYHCRKVHWRQLRSRSGAQILTRGCILFIAQSFKHI